MEQLSIPYFRGLLSENIKNLQSCCKRWEKIRTDSSIPEEVHDEIRTNIGLTNLLLGQKLKQFSGLIDDSEFKRGEKEITYLDLQGFWDMVYTEVEKIQKKFENLEKCKENDWILVQENKDIIQLKKKTLPSVIKTVVSTKSHSSAARQRLAEAKLKMKAKMAVQSENVLKRPAADEVNNDLNSKIIVIKKDIPNRKGSVNMQQNSQDSNNLKSTISNIANIQISQQGEQNIKVNSSKKVPSSKGKSRNKIIETFDKENYSSGNSEELQSTKTPLARKGASKNKEVIPLQCLTRSAKKALLAKQNDL